MPDAIERRVISLATGPVRIEERADKKTVISGYAAVFYDAEDEGTEYQLYPGLRERVMPTAFDRAIREAQDCRGLFNHDPNMLLGRCSAGTMKLSVDKKGLRYEIEPPDTQAGRDVITSIKRGDLTGSSFSFKPVVQKYQLSMSDEEDDVRELHDVELFDCGPVSFPAYSATTTGMRALGEAAAEVRQAHEAARSESRIGTRPQSILVPKDGFTKAEAEKWCKDHDFKAEADETDNYYRFRQFDPGQCSDTPKTITLSEKDGIKAVICTPKEGKAADCGEGRSWVPSTELMRMRQRMAEVEG